MTDPNVNTVKAFNKARAARILLEESADALGFESVHDLADATRDNELPDGVDDIGVEAITNAHSYLNNGSIDSLDEEW